MKKFELTAENKLNWFGHELYRIRALIAFKTTNGEKIDIGDLGGYVESEKNLSHDEKAWIFGDAEVWGAAEVYGNAKVLGNAEVWGDAKVWGDAEVYGNAKILGDAEVYGNAKILGNAEVYGNAKILGNAEVWGDAAIFSTEHILSITPIGASVNSLTFFRTKTRKIGVSFEWGFYALNVFEQLIANWADKFKVTARMAIEIAKVHIDLASTAPFGDCRNCGKEFNSELVSEYEITHCPWCGEVRDC